MTNNMTNNMRTCSPKYLVKESNTMREKKTFYSIDDFISTVEMFKRSNERIADHSEIRAHLNQRKDDWRYGENLNDPNSGIRFVMHDFLREGWLIKPKNTKD